MESNNKLLSIVIPVYNVERYIFQCINSIFQGIRKPILKEFEIIIVDDCSPDDSIKNITPFLEDYDNITLITHKENKGLGGARNTGILNSKGKFITFLDSDDFYSPGAVEKLVLWLATLNEETLLIFGFRAVQGEEIKWQYKPKASMQVEAQEVLRQLSVDKITPAAWNKVFSQKTLKKVNFEPHIYYEDLEFTPRAISKCKNVQFKTEVLVNYRLEGTSITRQSIKKKHVDDFLLALDHLNNAIDDKIIFSNFFFNRWRHLLKIWQLDITLFDYSLRQLDEACSKYELNKLTREHHLFLELLDSTYKSFTPNPRLEQLYAEVTLNLQMPYPFFSIIIPVYNAGNFIEKAIENFSQQHYWNFELVLVDDKSTDDSAQKIKSLQSKYDFIQLIELHTNSGAGVARNTGLENARGKYIIFNDADDWFDKNGLEIINQHLIENEFPDLVVYSFSVYDQNNKFIWAGEKIESIPSKSYTGSEIFSRMCTSQINPSPWNKVFLKEIWVDNDIRFPSKIHHQDLAAIPFAAYKAKSGTILKSRLYNYVTNNTGVTQTVSDKHVVSPFEAINSLFKFFEKDSSFDTWRVQLLLLAFQTFDYNLGLRMSKFNDQQILNYLQLFNLFCSRFRLESHYLLNSISATQCMEKLNNEILKRGLEAYIQPWQSKESFEKLLSHYLFIIKQHNLLIANNKQDNGEQLNRLKSEIKKTTIELEDLKRQKNWYFRTYEHLPKWFLKIGSIFRRL